MPKKILVVDDSALMRRVLCDIIDTDIRFQVADRAKDGLEAFDLLSRNSYDSSCPGCEYAAYERPAAFTGAA